MVLMRSIGLVPKTAAAGHRSVRWKQVLNGYSESIRKAAYRRYANVAAALLNGRQLRLSHANQLRQIVLRQASFFSQRADAPAKMDLRFRTDPRVCRSLGSLLRYGRGSGFRRHALCHGRNQPAEQLQFLAPLARKWASDDYLPRRRRSVRLISFSPTQRGDFVLGVAEFCRVIHAAKIQFSLILQFKARIVLAYQWLTSDQHEEMGGPWQSGYV